MPTMEILENLNILIKVLQQYRTILGKEIDIVSSWRTPQEQENLLKKYKKEKAIWLNNGKKGHPPNIPSTTSLHLEGLAIDVSVTDGSHVALQKLVNESFAGEAEFGWNYTHLGLTTFSKSYLQRHGLFRNDIYRKLVLDVTKLPKEHRAFIEKRINPANWNIRYDSTFDPIKNKEMFSKIDKKQEMADTGFKDNLNFSKNIKELPKYFDTEKIINKYSKDFGKKIKGTDTGLAADLYSEE